MASMNIIIILLLLVKDIHSKETNPSLSNKSSNVAQEASLVNIKITHLSAEIGRPLNIKLLKRNEQLKIHSGLSLTIKCQVTGKPEPSVAWYRRTYPNTVEKLSSSKKNEAILQFASISQQDSSNYSCRAQNSNGFIVKWIQVQVISSEVFNDVTKKDWTSELNMRPCSENSRCQFKDCKTQQSMMTCLMRCDLAHVSVPQVQRRVCPSHYTSTDCVNSYYIIFGFALAFIIGVLCIILYFYRFHKLFGIKTHSSNFNRNNHNSQSKFDKNVYIKCFCQDNIVYEDAHNGHCVPATLEPGQVTSTMKNENMPKFQSFEPLMVNGYFYKPNILE